MEMIRESSGWKKVLGREKGSTARVKILDILEEMNCLKSGNWRAQEDPGG
jgi:hypothetical protein